MLITCKDCGARFQGTPAARYCKPCVKRRISDSAKQRRLCDIGAGARWGQKEKAGGQPKWIGPSAELKPIETGEADSSTRCARSG